MKKILVTGANGFVGRKLVAHLTRSNDEVVRCVRSARTDNFESGLKTFVVGDINNETDWRISLKGVDSIVHLAGRVHILHDSVRNPLGKFRRINVDGTINLARQSVAAGVKRFIFISSIKVNGEFSCLGEPFTADAFSSPTDPYAVSKFEAENSLFEIAEETGLEVVIIRPPLIYGADVKANFFRMMQYLSQGIPLPFGAIYNKRSFVALGNLVDLIETCLDHPAAANEVFLVSDGEDLSTTELLKRLGLALGKPARLLPVPQWLLEIGLKMLGKGDMAQRLCCSLHVDIYKTRRLLGWSPLICVDEALVKTARAYLDKT